MSTLACTILVALAFAASGISKLLDVATFAEQLRAYRLLPETSISVAAIAIPVLELLLAVALLRPTTRARALPVAATALVLFTLVVAATLANGLDIECGCVILGGSSARVGPAVLVRNLGLLALIAVAWAGTSSAGTSHARTPHAGTPRAHTPHAGTPHADAAGAKPTPGSRSRAVPAFVTTAFVILLYQLVLVSQASEILRRQVDLLEAAMRPLAPGDPAPVFEAARLDEDGVLGPPGRVAFGDVERTTLLVFSSDCDYCKASLPAWNARARAAGPHERVLGVSVDTKHATEAFVDRHGPVFDVLLPVDVQGFAASYRLTSVPHAIEIDRDGRVLSTVEGLDPGSPAEHADVDPGSAER